MLNRKISVKVVKVKLLKDIKQFSVWQLMIFVLVFAGIGGYAIWHSFADTGTTVIAADDFNRPDSNPVSGNWETRPGVYPMQIISDQLAKSNDTQQAWEATYNGSLWKDAIPSDADVEITIAAKGSAHEPVCMLFFDEALNGQLTYCIYPVDQTIFLSGVTDPITYYPSFPVNAGDRIGLRISGTTVDAMRNGVAVYTRTIPTSSVNWRRVEVGSQVEHFNPGGGLLLDDFSVTAAAADPVISNEFPICGDQDGSETPLIKNCPDYVKTTGQQMLVVPGTGPVNLTFDMVWRLGIFSDEMAVFRVDDDAGTINGLKPGDPGYWSAVYGRAQILAPGPSTASSPDKTLTFNGGDRLVLMLVTTTLSDLMANNPNNNPSYTGSAVAYFSFDKLNPDGQDHVLAWQNAKDGSSQFAFEDWITNGGNFNDVGIDVREASGALSPPSAPTGLLAKTVSNTQIGLSWHASASTTGIASYKIYENVVATPEPGEEDSGPPPSLYIGTTTDTSYQVTDLQPNTSYSFYVVAVDTAGNVSGQSNNAGGLTGGATVPCVSSKTNRCLSGVSWPYASPFGDNNCSSAKASTCRPMTMQTCSDGTSQATTPTLISSALDQGVDYAIDSVQPGCTYDNPNPADTGTSSTSNMSKSNTRVYAMGDGKIICVGGNPGFGETDTFYQTCPGGNGHLGNSAGTWLIYQLSSGPAKGLDIYVAEGCTLSGNAISNSLANKTLGRRWSDGRMVINGKKIAADKVTANSVLCELSNGTIETGWANEDTQNINGGDIVNAIIPAAYSCQWKVLKSHVPTVWGHSMNEFIEMSGGPSGTRYALINGKLVFDPVYHSCTQYPMTAKYANPAWYDTSRV
jgi:hypothetical protein